MADDAAGAEDQRGLTRRRALGVGLGVGAGAWALGSGTAGAEPATATTLDPTGLQVVTASTVQDALEQVDARLEGTLGGPGVINVRDYGAVGDGVTNDMPAVIDAVMAEKPTSNPLDWVPRFDPAVGGVLYFPPGTYSLSLMMLWFNGLHVVGAGAGTTTLLFRQASHAGGDRDAAPKLWFTDPRFDRRIHDVSIRDLTIRTDLRLTGDDPRGSGDTVLTFYAVDRLRVSGVEVADSPSFGISVWDCTEVVVDHCYVHDTHIDGIHLASVTHGVVHGCRVDHTGDDAIAVSGGSDPATETKLSRQVVVSSNVVSRSGSNGIAAFGVDGLVLSDNTVSGTHQAGIGLNQHDQRWRTRNVVIRGNHVDGAGLYGESTDVLWGAGVPYGISVGRDQSQATTTIEAILIEGNLVDQCRNSFVCVERAADVTVSGNRLHGPLITEQPAPGSAQQQGSSGAGLMIPPPGAHGGGEASVFPAIRARRAPRPRVDNNVVRPASGQRAVLVEGAAAADVVRARVSDNSIDRGTSPPLGTQGVDEIAIGPAGVVAYQGGNDVNGLALAPVNTPA